MVVIAVLAASGVAGATYSQLIKIRGKGSEAARLVCPGGMTNLGYELSELGTVFPDDPATHIDDVYTVAVEQFEVERVTMSSHTGTHLDVPRHFIEGERGLTDLNPEEFVWPAYKIKVSELDLDEGQLQITKADIKAYEDEYGKIKAGSLVVLDTAVTDEFDLDDPHDERIIGDSTFNDAVTDTAQNVDDFWELDTEGFEGAAVQWMFDKRNIAGVGSDAYGPDASDDAFFDATYTTLLNDGVALVAINNVESLNVNGDIILAPTVRLSEGSGFPTNPIACHGGADDDHDDDDDDDDNDD